MKAECLKEKLEKAISIVDKATSKNPTLPILANILLIATKDSLLIKATNLEIGIEIKLQAKVEKEGRVAIKGQTLVGFLSNSTSGKNVSLELVNENILVKSGDNVATIKAVNSEDFPEISRIPSEVSVEASLKGLSLSTAIKSVFYAASNSQVKPELSSVVFYGDGKNLILVSTDSFRLAEKKLSVDSSKEIPQVIVPVKNAIELGRVSEEIGGDTAKIFFGNNQIAIEGNNIYIVSRVVEGSFPDYKQIIPKNYKTELVVLKEDLLKALKTAMVFSDSFNQTVIAVSPSKKRVEIRSKNNDVGEGNAVLQGAITGESMEISFNNKYMFDCLQSISSDSVSINFAESNKPAVIRGIGDSSFTYIVMPMNR
jgi:DNA polymerase-3 subunit beta